jgi:hypothetical protein
MRETETKMNPRTSIVTAVAILALAVPAAAGARSISMSRVAKETTATREFDQTLAAHKSHVVKTGKSSKNAAGKSSAPSVSPVIYIHVPTAANPPVAVTDPNECQDSGNRCSDQQACEYWGMNCDSSGGTTVQTPSQPAAPAAPSAQADSTAASVSTTTDGFNASNCWDYTTYQATLNPASC